jgi:hypothetical protein
MSTFTQGYVANGLRNYELGGGGRYGHLNIEN